MSSRILSSTKQHQRAVLHVYKFHYRQKMTRSSQDINDGFDIYGRYMVLPFFVYLPLLIVFFWGEFWIPIINVDRNKLPSKVCDEYIERTYAERCSQYSSGHAFHPFINDQLFWIVFLIFFTLVLFMAFCGPRSRLDPKKNYSNLSLGILICLTISSICVQICSTLTCRPTELIFDFRFLSVIVVQFTGFVACILFTIQLGATYAMEIPVQAITYETLMARPTLSLCDVLKDLILLRR
ncbi:unnamed protein product [Rotaria socialis]|uniref:Uncharacterized protein n=2 Tax=Rotaria socialis TaxID=392032 RepID=A0A818WYK4_9BILA|nr:unnamed protein product [Rotaria socialis]